MSTLPEYLETAYEVDVDEQIMVHADPNIEHDTEGAIRRFIVDDEDKANWALRKLARIVARQLDIQEQARKERERIAAWEAEQTQKIVREQTFFESLLEQFHRNQLTADPLKKTIKLPAGTLKARQLPARVEVYDDFVDWAKSQDRSDLLRVTVAPDKAAIKQAVLKDGEVLNAVEVYPGEVRYSVEVTS